MGYRWVDLLGEFEDINGGRVFLAANMMIRLVKPMPQTSRVSHRGRLPINRRGP